MSDRGGWLVATGLLLATAAGTGLLSNDPAPPVAETRPTTTVSTLTPSPTAPVLPDRPTGSSVAIADLGGVWFVDRQHGFAVVDGRLVGSVDGGGTWRVVGSAIPPEDLGYTPGRLVFTGRSDGYLYGRGLRVTHDGGATWADPQLARYVDLRDGPRDADVLALQPVGRSVWALVNSGGEAIDLHISDDGVSLPPGVSGHYAEVVPGE